MEAPYLEELRSKRKWLAFANGRLESEYRRHSAGRDRKDLRVQMLFACVMIGLMMLMDRTFLSAEFAERSILLRAAFMLPPMFTLFALTWTRQLKYWIQPLGFVIGLSVGLTSLVIGAIAARYDQPRVFAGYQIITVFVYFFLGLRVPTACATAVTLFAAFIIAAAVNSANPVSVGYNGLYLLFLNVFCSIGAYRLERSRRKEFLEDRVLSYRANFDALTGLQNRRAFDEVLESTWENAQDMHCAIAVLLIDIDHFKTYNDKYGHQAGDNTIREVAGILADALHRPQDFAGRYGGEEFVVLLFDTTREYAMQLAAGIRQQVLDRNIEHAASSTAACVSVSIGLSFLEPYRSERSAAGFVQSADQALYAAKQGGRNRVVDADDSAAAITTGVFRVTQLDGSKTLDAQDVRPDVADGAPAKRSGQTS